MLSLALLGNLKVFWVVDESFQISPEVIFFALYSLVMIVVFQQHNLYKINVFLSGADQIIKLTVSLFYSMLGFAFITFLTKAALFPESRLAVSLFFIIAFFFLTLERVAIFRYLFNFVSKSPSYKRNVLIVGGGRVARILAANLSLNNGYGMRIAGFLDDETSPGTSVFLGAKILGSIDEAVSIARKHRIAEVIIALENVTHDRLLQIVDMFTSRRPILKIASPLYDVIPAKLFTERYGNIPITSILNQGAMNSQTYTKRLFDFVFALLGLILLTPIFILVAIAIRLDGSKGPIFYSQIRLGKEGKPFRFYKFRSMHFGSDKDESRKSKVGSFIRDKSKHSGPRKIVDDGKITRVGKFLRKTSLDELPQLLNVLKGEMSLVGPRPCLPYEWEQYETWHKKRLSVLPGCTGVWQVAGRSEISFDDMVILDLYYIHNASILFDLQLILKTIPVMLLGKGAR
jgi:undecaprenyl-phosphate galactose phosphotransferase